MVFGKKVQSPPKVTIRQQVAGGFGVLALSALMGAGWRIGTALVETAVVAVSTRTKKEPLRRAA